MKEQINKIKFLLNEKLTLYPFLFGILFLTNELRNNSAFNTQKENISLILIVLSFSLLVDYLCRKFIKNNIKAALTAALFVFINLFYGDLFYAILGQKLIVKIINAIFPSHPGAIIFILIIVVWLIITFLILTSRKSLKRLNIWLNVLLISFVLLEIIQWITSPVPQIRLIENEPFPVNTNLSSKEKPDIYYIILDSYTSSESLKKYWNYDNSNFEDSLNRLGFIIDKKSNTPLTSTPYCLASYLNSSTLKFDSAINYNDRNLSQLIRNNRLFDWLSKNEYLCYNFSIFDAFGKKRYYNFFTYDHFLGRTIWYSNLIKIALNLIPSSHISHINLKIFNQLSSLPKKNLDKPLFVYAHIMMPHSPYTFDEYGNAYNSLDSLTGKQKYLNQLIFTNFLTLSTINNIIKFSLNKPIIVIQGDHGYRNLMDTTSTEKSNEGHTIFYAIYTPNDIMVPYNINSINTFNKLIEKINHTKICHKKPLL